MIITEKFKPQYKMTPYKDIPIGGLWKFAANPNGTGGLGAATHIKTDTGHDLDLATGILRECEKDDTLVYYIVQSELILTIS